MDETTFQAMGEEAHPAMMKRLLIGKTASYEAVNDGGKRPPKENIT